MCNKNIFFVLFPLAILPEKETVVFLKVRRATKKAEMVNLLLLSAPVYAEKERSRRPCSGSRLPGVHFGLLRE